MIRSPKSLIWLYFRDTVCFYMILDFWAIWSLRLCLAPNLGMMIFPCSSVKGNW